MATEQADMNSVGNAITAFLNSRNLQPNPQWLQTFISSIRLNAPVPALQQTALFRVLATDLTTSVLSGLDLCFPTDISNAEIRERRLRGPTTVQVLDIEDIGRSRWSQVEAIEMEERGEMTKGREVIRVVADENDNSDPNPPAPASATSTGPHKLLLQDSRSTKAYACELQRVQGIGVHLAIGSKLVLKDALVARGVIMLEPRCVEVLGGKVEVWDKKWRMERKMTLKEKAGWTETRI